MYLLSSSLRAGRLSHLLGHLLPPPLSWRWYMYCAFGGAVFWPARLQQSDTSTIEPRGEDFDPSPSAGKPYVAFLLLMLRLI